MMTLPPLSLYVHIPWCVKKCPYCDFNSHESSDINGNIPEVEYLAQLKLDLAEDLQWVQGRSLQSIFFGGGTPSLMSGEFYQDLLAHIESVIPFHPKIEITLEANPGTTEADRFKAYRVAGINRLSVGVQSFHAEHLKRLGRIHSNDDAVRAIQQAKAAGFENFNIDLMHGLSEQTLEEAMNDLKQAIALEPTHLSWYQLTIEQNTEYYRHPPKLPEDEALWDIQKAGAALLKRAGFDQYEVSAFSKAGREAQHNLNYWHFGDYIGIGAGAHSKITKINLSKNSSDSECILEGILRYRKTRMPKDYLLPKPSFRIGQEEVVVADLGFEFLMNALRLNRGVDTSLFTERTGLALNTLEPQLSEFRNMGLIELHRLCTTKKGHLFLNSILEKFADV
ncbi:MAG: oxygen-independent coproporphyrinogen-3 oxidase [Oleiphilaceae bacterium]|jgi:oxygen-independent coproporphyrinogen-3 oxidase